MTCVVFSNRTLPSSCEAQPITLAAACVVWELHGTPLVNNSTRHSPFPAQGFTWWHKMSSLGIVLLNMWWLHLDSFPIHIYFKKTFIAVGFHMVFQMAHSITCSFQNSPNNLPIRVSHIHYTLSFLRRLIIETSSCRRWELTETQNQTLYSKGDTLEHSDPYDISLSNAPGGSGIYVEEEVESL